MCQGNRKLDLERKKKLERNVKQPAWGLSLHCGLTLLGARGLAIFQEMAIVTRYVTSRKEQ